MKNGTLIKPLRECTKEIPILVNLFIQEWPSHYGESGPGNARLDIESYANEYSLPIGLVAYRGNLPCGLMALKADSISTHSHLGPWVAAGFVAPESRKQGIGSILLSGIEKVANDMNFKKLYSGTARAHGLLLRSGWHKKETVVYGGENVSIYSKQL